MLKYLKSLFHRHGWVVIDKQEIIKQHKYIQSQKHIVGTLYVLQCKHCGEIKKKVIEV